MPRVLCAFLLLSIAAWAQDSASILRKVAERYRTLDAYRVEGTFSRMENGLRPGVPPDSRSGKFIVAGVESAHKTRVEWMEADAAITTITDGATTWTGLPKQKEYTKVEASRSGDGTETEIGGDYSSFARSLAIERYRVFDKLTPQSRIGGEQNVKLGHDKIKCWVILAALNERTEKIWVDQQRFLVLRSEESWSRQGRPVITSVEIKRFDLTAPDPTEFSFVPPPNWRAVDELDIPGMMPSFTGKPAPDFALQDIDGDVVRLSDLRGKVVVIDFWATWCPPCRRELPAVNKLAAELKDRDVVVLGINDEGAGTVKSFNKKHAYTFRTLEDHRGKVHRDYRADAIPNVFVVNREGVVVRHFVGTREEPELMDAIRQAGFVEPGTALLEDFRTAHTLPRDVRELGPNASLPTLLFKVEPRYTPEARAAHITGTVLVKLEIDEKGLPRNIAVAKGLGSGLDEAAISAVAQWRFKPAMKDGRPISSQSTVQVSFR